MKDNFTIQSDQYARFRPVYPEAMYDQILRHTSGRDCAWDCGTGNGQVASDLALYFKTVYATDISSRQIGNAVQRHNIIYKTEPAESTAFSEQMFDLITVAQAIHWFDFETFYHEVRRVSKPGATLAVMGYGLIDTHNDALNKVISTLYRDITGPYWDKERRYIDESYQTIPFPFIEIKTEPVQHELQWTLETLEGYLGTWSSVQHYIAARGYNPIDLVRKALHEAWGKQEQRLISFPMLLRLGIING